MFVAPALSLFPPQVSLCAAGGGRVPQKPTTGSPAMVMAFWCGRMPAIAPRLCTSIASRVDAERRDIIAFGSLIQRRQLCEEMCRKEPAYRSIDDRTTRQCVVVCAESG